MTKTELLEEILAELRAIHALLEAPADLPTPADEPYVAVVHPDQWEKLLHDNSIPDDEAVYIVQEIAEAGRY